MRNLPNPKNITVAAMAVKNESIIIISFTEIAGLIYWDCQIAVSDISLCPIQYNYRSRLSKQNSGVLAGI
jgi:hypothetical protein